MICRYTTKSFIEIPPCALKVLFKREKASARASSDRFCPSLSLLKPNIFLYPKFIHNTTLAVTNISVEIKSLQKENVTKLLKIYNILFCDFWHNKFFMIFGMYKPNRGPWLQRINNVEKNVMNSWKFSGMCSVKFSIPPLPKIVRNFEVQIK